MRLFSGRNRPVHLGPYPLELLKRASPFPAPPDPPIGGSFRLAMPIEFKIR